MSNRTEKEDTRWAKYRSGITRVGQMIEDYPGAVPLANEIVAIFRSHGCCLDKHGVSYDGPMCKLIEAALLAAERYGNGQENTEPANPIAPIERQQPDAD